MTPFYFAALLRPEIASSFAACIESYNDVVIHGWEGFEVSPVSCDDAVIFAALLHPELASSVVECTISFNDVVIHRRGGFVDSLLSCNDAVIFCSFTRS